MNCTKSDRDIPEIVCGHSLPCPYHTVTINISEDQVPTITIPATIMKKIDGELLNKLKKVAKILKEE